MAEPGKAVAGDGRGEQPKPFPGPQRYQQQHQQQSRAQDVQAPSGRHAVLRQICGIELPEALKLVHEIPSWVGQGASGFDVPRSMVIEAKSWTNGMARMTSPLSAATPR